MQCPSLEELHSFADGEVGESASLETSDRHTEISSHLDSCSHCSRKLEEIRTSNDLLGQIQHAVQENEKVATRSQIRFEPGSCVAGYKLLRKVYAGGQAEVFEAEHLGRSSSSNATSTSDQAQASNNSNRLAIKIWKQPLRVNTEHYTRFLRELNAIRSFEHEAIVSAVDGGIRNEVGYLVMPFVEGEAIDRFFAGSDSSDFVMERVRVLTDVCAGVAYAHSRGTFHRDLKPANILVQPNAKPKVLDFGLAKSFDSVLHDGQSSASEYDAPTETGQFLGTLAFASPEQTTGKPNLVDARCDVYSLGVTAYLILAGRMPYRTAGPIAEVISNIQSARIEPPSKWRSEISRDLDAIVMKSLEREPRDRYQTVDAIRADFQNYLNGDLIEARRNSHWHLMVKTMRRNVGLVSVASIVFLSLIAALISGLFALAQTNRALELAEENLDRERELAEAAIEAQEVAEMRSYMASITAATMSGNPRSARDWLDNAPPSKRHWEWHYLKRISDQTGSLLQGNERYVECVRSAGNDLILSTGWDGTLRAWDTKNNREVRKLRLHKHVWGLAVSPSREIAAVGDFDGRVHIVDLNSFDVTKVIQGPDAPVFGCAFSADGTELACTFSRSKQSLVPPLSSTICVFATKDWSQTQAIDIESSTRIVVPYKQGTWLVSGLSQSAIISTADGLVETLPASTTLGYSSELQLIFLAEFGSTLNAYDPKAGFERPRWKYEGGVINELAVDPAGQEIALASRQSVVRVLDAATGFLQQERVGHDWAVSSCDFHSSGTLVTGGWDKTVRTWNMNPAGSAFQYWNGHAGPVHFLKFANNLIFSGAQDGTLRIWNPEDGATIQILEFGAPVWSLAFSPSANGSCCIGLGDGTMILAQFEANRIRQTGKVELGKDGSVHDIVFLDDHKVIACTATNRLVTYDLENQELIHEDRSHRGHIHRITRLGDDKLITADHDVIRVWNNREMEIRDEFKRSIYRDDFTLEVVDDAIIAGRNPGQIGIWKVDSEGQASLIDTLNGHGDEVLDLAVHPDGTRLVSCAADGSTKIWDLENRKLLSVIHCDQSELCRVEFGPKGEILLGGAQDGRILIWNQQTNAPSKDESHVELVAH